MSENRQVYVLLSTFRSSIQRGRSPFAEMLWIIVESFTFATWIPGSSWRVRLLRMFGASIGTGVVIKPKAHVKFPWKLTIGSHSWIGESVWIDNMAPVNIGSDCCVSQGAYICSGSHNWSDPAFHYVEGNIEIGDESWIAAHAKVAAGVSVGRGAVLTLGSIATKDLLPGWIHQGNPAMPIKVRTVLERNNK